MRSRLVVWYNTKCPVCDNLEPEALARFGVGIEEVRRRLHAVNAEGRLFVGVDCAIETACARRATHGLVDCWAPHRAPDCPLCL